MDRREFLKSLIAAGAAISISPVRSIVAAPREVPKWNGIPIEGNFRLHVIDESGRLLASVKLAVEEATKEKLSFSQIEKCFAFNTGVPYSYALLIDGDVFASGSAGRGWGELNFNDSIVSEWEVKIYSFLISR